MTTKWQHWMRAYSTRLSASYDASSKLEHKVTKGESRENQILDFLDSLLPQRVTVGRNVTVIDQKDSGSPNFDGVLIDRSELPLLHKDGDMLVAMIESVCLCLEVKSNLDSARLAEVITNSRRLHEMTVAQGGPWPLGPWVTSFAYDCPNINLAFLDFAVAYHKDPLSAPAHVCILNQALFVPLDTMSASPSILDVPRADSTPGLLRPASDALLVYLYLVSRFIGRPESHNAILETYSADLLNNQTAFNFDADFLALLATDDETFGQARDHFKGTATEAIAEVYEGARKAIGL